jgi:hypothetical protein
MKNCRFIKHMTPTFTSAVAMCLSAFAVFIACNGKSPNAPVTVTYQLTVLAGTGGTITAPSSSPVTVNKDAATTITASPNTGYIFQKWTAAAECATIAYKNAASTIVRLTQGNDTVGAVFIPVPPGLNPFNPGDLGRLEAGVSYNYYTGAWTSLPVFSVLVPEASDSCGSFDVSEVPHRSTGFGIVFSGYINIPYDADYTFYVKSSDGSALLLNDSVIIDNDGIHSSPNEASATVTLAEGKYLISVQYFDATSSPACTISYACPSIGIDKTTISNGILYRPFTGPVPKIIIIRPAGGETYHLGDSLHVRWIYRYFDDMVYCDISIDNGANYTLISPYAFGHTDTNGHMDWKIPVNDSLVTHQARIRVRDYPPGGDFCVSNAFSIDSL